MLGHEPKLVSKHFFRNLCYGMPHLFLPKMALRIDDPTLRSSPCLVVGMPVVRANFCLAREMPKALFHEKDNPGIFIVDVWGYD